MITTVFGDVHSCGPGLLEVLAKNQDADRLIWLGDIVGYGPNPAECFEIATYFDKASNHYVLGGNHDLMTATGTIPLYVDPFARASIKWSWEEWLGISNPEDLKTATQVLERKIKRGIRIPEGSEKRSLFGRLSEVFRDRTYIPREEVPKILEGLSRDDRETAIKYLSSKEKSDKVNDYINFLVNLKPELVFPQEGLMFSHAFPLSMIEHAGELGIDKTAVENREVYIVSKEEWKKKREERIEYCKHERMSEKATEEEVLRYRTLFAIAEDVVELLAEGIHTLFVGHKHEPLLIESKDKSKRIVRPGAVFNPRDPDDNKAYYVRVDSESPDRIDFFDVEYDRSRVNKQMEEAGYLR